MSGEGIEALLERHYAVGSVKRVERITGGYGSLVYLIRADSGAFILRHIDDNGMNHPENEAAVVETVRQDGIPTPEIIQGVDGRYLITDGGQTYQLRRYVNGRVLSPNTAPEWLMADSAILLGRIQRSLEKLPPLPAGLGQAYFDYMTPERALTSHMQTLEHALRMNHADIAQAVREKIEMIRALKPDVNDLSRLTFKNTHGDYKIQQLICDGNRINAVIDFTGACVHPVCFEVIRSYIMAAPECAGGSLDIDNFKTYISHFLRYGALSDEDLMVMPYLFYYQITVADYFGQFYTMDEENGRQLLRDSYFFVRLGRWLEDHMIQLEKALKNGI